ncbi:MAG TPA: signal peptidase II [Clostridia bacterium]|nr:signal peptidase II [Clostridia bacterium]
MLIAGVVLVILLADQVSKYLVQIFLSPGETVPVIQNIFHFTYVQNPGAAFGILAHRTYFFIVMALLVILLIVIFFRQIDHRHLYLRLGLALALGGALGNLVDRLRFGHVIDFLDFRFWPVFNLADTAIVVGVGLLCWEILRSPESW